MAIQYLVYIAVRFLAWLSTLCSDAARSTLATVISAVHRSFDSHRYQATLSNIRDSFPEHGHDWHHRIARESYVSLALTMLELMAGNKAFDLRNIRFEHPEWFEELKAADSPVLLLSGHFGNWEWGAMSVSLKFELDILMIVKRMRNHYVDQFINRCRATVRNQIVDMNQAAKPIVTAVAAKKVIALLSDQAADPVRDVFVNFFGREAVTVEAPASLALRYRIPIIAAYAVRESAGCYYIRMQKIEHSDLESNSDGIHELVQRYTTSLEGIIREYPGQWSWQHKRWKYSPDDYRA